MDMFSLVFGLYAAMMMIAGLVCAIEVKFFKRFEKKLNKPDEKPYEEEISNEIDDVKDTKDVQSHEDEEEIETTYLE